MLRLRIFKLGKRDVRLDDVLDVKARTDRMRLAKLRNSKPAATSKTMASEISAPARKLRARRRLRLSPERPPSAKVDCISALAADMAGPNQKSACDQRKGEAQTPGQNSRREWDSSAASSTAGDLQALEHPSTRELSASPPSRPSTAVSLSNWRMIRARPAPSAFRTAISFAREVARVRSKLAILAQAIK